MSTQRSYSYQSLQVELPRQLHPRTISAIVLLLLMLLILFVLHFIIAPKYSTISTLSGINNQSAASTTTSKPTTLVNTVTLKYTSDFTHCPENTPLPGVLDQLTSGIDITSYDLFSSASNSSSTQKGQIFEFTCNKGQHWSHPDKTEPYSIPDQLSSVVYLAGDRLQIKTNIYRTLEEYRKSLVGRFRVENAVDVFAASDTWREVQKVMLQEDSSIFEIFSYLSTFKLHLRSSLTKFTRQFIDSLTALPAAYSEAPSAYDHFVETFGTHYFDAVLLGSSHYQRTTIPNEYLYRDDRRKAVSVEIVKQFLRQLNPEEFTNGTTEVKNPADEEDSSFPSQAIFTSIGTQTSPWIYAGSLRPIESLIPDPNIRKQIHRAIHIRRVKGQLEGLKSYIEFSKVVLPPEEGRLFEHICQFLEDEMYHRYGEQVEKVEEKIGEVFEKAKELKDRATLSTYFNKLKSTSDDIFHCKWSLTRACHTGLMDYDLQGQNSLDEQLRIEYLTLLNAESPPDRKAVVSLLQRTVQHIDYHRKTTVDICGSYSTEEEKGKCSRCVQHNVDCWYAKELACKTEAAWRVIRYRPPAKGNCACRTMINSPQPRQMEVN